jgi:hypothetical protein
VVRALPAVLAINGDPSSGFLAFIEPHDQSNHTISPTTRSVQPHDQSNHTISPTTKAKAIGVFKPSASASA